LPRQLPLFFADLRAPDLASAIAVVHSRFSTNTFPTWDLAQPFRYIAHNGEINTLRGNCNWMQARRSQLRSAKFHGGLDRLHPIIVPGKSDSAQFDNLVELLTLGGRTLPHALMMMIPGRERGTRHRRRAPELLLAPWLVEPWMARRRSCSDGQLVGATLDRSGLRPALDDHHRRPVTGVGDRGDRRAARAPRQGRSRPHDVRGRYGRGRIVDDPELKRGSPGDSLPQVARQNVFEMLFEEAPAAAIAGTSWAAARAHGYTDEAWVLSRRWRHGKEPIGRWAPTRRCGLGFAPNLSATSTSCSRRSRTHRSIRSARRS
jgi:glutamate synthase (NADPH/NADH) large chain